MYFVDCFEPLAGNPRAMTYVNADLGAAERSNELLQGLVSGGAIRLLQARCLDIGSSNGALLLAAHRLGARECVGVEIDSRRLESARRVAQGYPMTFHQMDAATQPLPGAHDVIFCLDVLEHVADWAQLVRHATNALAPGGTMFLSLHNARQFETVLSEPHYGVPGLVLLPPEAAAECWLDVRDIMGSALDYEVTSWPSYVELRDLCRGLDIEVSPWVDCTPAFNRGFWEAPDDAITSVVNKALAELKRLGIPEPHSARLLTAVEAYQREALLSFELAAAADESERVDYYVTYHGHPLSLVLRRS
jgi:SAM-dependent methyltransferase